MIALLGKGDWFLHGVFLHHVTRLMLFFHYLTMMLCTN